MNTKPPSHSRRVLLLVTAMVISQQVSAAGVLEEVIVTAQKRVQNLNDIGVAVSAFSGDQMRDLGITNAMDLASFTPGLHLTETGVTGVPVYTIRGVGFDDYNANSSSTVGLYVDEVNLPYPTMTRGEVFDMERIEVLKGPQGTLYGRNSTGGAINFISNKPSEYFEAGVSLEYSRYDTFRSEGFINGSLGQSVNGRLAFAHKQSGEGWQNSASSDEKLGELDSTALRGILDWTVSESVDLQISAHWYEDQSENPAPQYFTYVPLVPDYAPFFPPPPEEQQPDLSDPRSAEWSRDFTPQRDNTGAGASLRFDWDMGNVSLISITAYEQFERDESNDWDGSAVENLDVFMDTDIEVWSQEVRLTSNSDSAVSWIAGAYFSSDEVNESWEALGSQSTIYYGIFGSVDTRYKQESTSAALFGNLEWNLSDQLRLNIGARYTEEEREWEGCSYDVDGGLSFLYNLNFGPTPGLSDRTILSGSTLSQGDCVVVDPSQARLSVDSDSGKSTFYSGNSGVFKDDFSTENFSGKLGVDWFPSEDWLVYGSISNGYKSGGYNGAAASTWDQLSPYDEETLLAYEIGFKATLLEGAMQLNSSAFFYDYTDKQIVGFSSDPVFGLLTQLVNVPESEIIGVEADLEWTPLEGLYLKFGAIWLDSQVNEYVGLDGLGNVQDMSGMELAQTSDWQYNGLVSYEWSVYDTLTMRIAVDANYKGEYQSAIDDNPLFFVDDYTIWNSRIGLGSSDGRWQLTAWGRNLTDEYYYTSANLSNDYWFRTAGKGLTYGLTLDYNFQ